MGSKGYFAWRESIERRQRENDQHMQSLLRQTRRLKEKNEELHVQMSSAGSSQSQKPQSQWIVSRRTDKTSFPGNVEFYSSSHTARYEEEFSPAFQVQLDKGIDSTLLSMKKRCDKRSWLSDAMRARLGPQTLGVEGKSSMVETLEARLDLSATIITSEWPSHPLRQWQVRAPTDRALPYSISRWLDDMLSTLFDPHIIN